MKHYLLIGLFFAFFSANAQVKPVYFNGESITNDKNNATSYAVYGKLSTEDLWVFKRYDLDDNLIQTGSYADEGLSIPHGKFVFYMDVEVFNRMYATNFKLKNKTRFASQQGSFVNGVEQGRWLLFYPDGNVFNAQDYVNGKLNGEFITYDKLGRIEISGNYVDGERDGEWIFDRGGKKAIYEKGVLKTSSNEGKRNKISTATVPVPNAAVKLPEPNRKHELFSDINLFNTVHGTNFSSKESKTFLAEQGNIVNNQQEGVWLLFYPDGKVLSKRIYVNGKLNGEFISYGPKGNIIANGSYVNDIKHGKWIENDRELYYDKGKVVSKPKEK